LDWKKLLAIGEKPKLFSPGDQEIWTDPYIGEHIVFAHLEPEEDDGTRMEGHVLQEVQFWVNRLGSNIRFLDLGCGPGIYLRLLAQEGWNCWGYDYNPWAIAYAKDLEGEEKLGIHYELKDIKKGQWERGFDAVAMIYGGMGVFSPEDRKLIAAQIDQSLKPGGCFFCDVFNEHYLKQQGEIPSWYVQKEEGFWSEKPHLVLPQVFEYPEYRALCRQFTVLEEELTKTYRLWYQALGLEDLQELFPASRYKIEVLDDLRGQRRKKNLGWSGYWVSKIS